MASTRSRLAFNIRGLQEKERQLREEKNKLREKVNTLLEIQSKLLDQKVSPPPSPEPVVFESIAALVISLSGKGWKFLRDLRTDIDVTHLPRFHSVHKLPDVSRDRETRAVIEFFSGRLEDRREQSQAEGSDEVRELNRYVATQGGPGTGKSYFLWKLAVLSPEEYPDVGNFIKQWIPIPISFNQTTSFSPETYDADTILGFSFRLSTVSCSMPSNRRVPIRRVHCLGRTNIPPHWIESHLLRRIGSNRICTEILKFACETAARSKADRRRPLFLIDEIMKVEPSNVNDNLLRIIGKLIDWDEIVVDVVITALSIKYLQGKQSNSGREIQFVPLERLDWNELKTSLLVLPEFKELHENPILKSEFVKLLADCCGHPRTEKLAVGRWRKVLPRSYSAVLAQLLPRPKILRPTLGAVCAAIKADAVALKNRLSGSEDPETFDELVCKGGFVNSFHELDSDTPRAIPRLSAIQLWKWATPGEGQEETVEKRATKMLLEVDAATSNFDGYSSEYFMLRWEYLTQLPVFQHKSASSVLGRYLRVVDSKPLADVNSVAQFGQKEIVYVDRSITEDLSTDQSSLDCLYYVGKSNPGFVYFYRERTSDDREILVLVEVKFSDVETEDQQLVTRDVNTKLAYCARALEGSGLYSPVDYQGLRHFLGDAKQCHEESRWNSLIYGWEDRYSYAWRLNSFLLSTR